MAEKENCKLFSEFAPNTMQEWIDKVTVDLKGADFNKKLVWRTNEGFNVQPMYRLENMQDLKNLDCLPGEFPFVRGNKKDNNDWYVRQDIVVEDLAEANKKALDVLNRGVDSLGFVLNGCQEFTKADMEVLLKDICLECVEINFVAGCKKGSILDAFKAVVEERGIAPEKIQGGINVDPLTALTRKGKNCCDKPFENVKVNLEKMAAYKNFKTIEVGGYVFNNSGSSIVQELGFSLAAGVEYLDKLTDAGMKIDEVAPKIRFHFATGSKYFMEIAKLRAARYLWAHIVKAYNPSCDCKCKMNIHAETSEWNKTVYDPNVNMLRTQTETMSAVLGGVDSFTVHPFDDTFECHPSDVAERVARNQQLLLKEECHLDKVVDPSAGSYYVEVLTNSLADVAWKLFLEVEDKGGFGAEVASGEIQKAVNASNEARKKAVATRREILLGTNQFPNFNEVAAEKIQNEAAGCCCGGHNCGEATITALDFSRGASEFEALRLATEKSGKTPKVFMLTIGNLAMRLARSQFSSNFFACAGYKVIDNLGFDTVEAGVEAAVEAGAEIVVLCSSDDEYAELAPAAYKALAGRAEFVVAGMPACMEDLKAVGIDQYVNVKSNVLETLKAFNVKLGIN